MPKIKVKGQTVQTGECPQTNGHTHTHGRYQTYYRPCYAVDKYHTSYCTNPIPNLNPTNPMTYPKTNPTDPNLLTITLLEHFVKNFYTHQKAEWI